MIKAVLFDLDVTLVNSIYDIGGAMNRALESLGQPGFTTEQYYHMVGNGMKKLCQRALAPDRQDLNQALLQRYQAEYLAHCCDDTVVYDGVRPLLERLHDRGCRLAVITNKPKDQADKVMGTLLPGAPLDVVWGQQPPFAVKPDPAVYRHVAGLLEGAPEDTLYCGDSDVDIDTARNSGMPCISVLWGFRDKNFLLQHGATTLVEKPEEILKVKK